MLQKIQSSKYFKSVSFLLALQLLSNCFNWNVIYAGDGGPTQPEVHSFEPVGTNQMVDLFTGDFTYNIPLFNLPGPDGGYPINLAYHSGIQMEQEASWVGLGWNINMGTVNRNARNLPDDYSGAENENIKIKTDVKADWTIGLKKRFQFELVGIGPGSGSNFGIGLNSGYEIYYNNYRGIGYSVEHGLSLNWVPKSSSIGGDLGFNVRLDNQEGISGDVTAKITVVERNDKDEITKSNTYGVSTGFSDRSGWNRDIQINSTLSLTKVVNSSKGNSFGVNIPVSASLSFARPIVSMSIPHNMTGWNANYSFTQGFSTIFTYTAFGDQIRFQISKLKDRNKEVNYKGYGYLNYQNTSETNVNEEKDYRVKDISRENDGLIHKDTRRLGVPTLTYDIYTVTGQGIGSSFRPYRSDIGTVVAPFNKSKLNGGSLSVEVGVGTALRVGFDSGLSFSRKGSKSWPNQNDVNYSFTTNNSSLSNSVYFKNYGELNEDNLIQNYGSTVASNKPVALKLSENDNFYDIDNIDLAANSSVVQINTQRQTRHKRAIAIEPFTNELIMYNGISIIPEFNVSYYQSGVINYNKTYLSSFDQDRSSLPKSQVGGYMATNTNGITYVYGLPAQINSEKDVVFSVSEDISDLADIQTPISHSGGKIDYKIDGTDKFYNSIEKPKYSHSYFLTSILGNDYVDLDNNKGPSDGDLGYWVKFNYIKAHDNFQWRSPYNGAVYDKGYETNFYDGKGRYTYGTKNVWYVATVETKTHIAEFILSDRNDSKQADDELNGGAGTKSYKKLDRINIYTKAERYKNGVFNANARPIQTCHFEYDYKLCQGTPDNPSPSENGKLTLRKVYFTYRGSNSGMSRPYSFEYNGEDILYSRKNIDRWGNYQPTSSSENVDYPYNNPLTSKSEMDQRAGLWNMSAINLPSGGRYEVDYESDSYAYVQNEVAMHMFKISSLEPYRDINNQLISPTTAIAHPKNAGGDHRKVYFQLEKPLLSSLSSVELTKEMQKYIRIGEYLYFKVKINLTKDNGTQEYVAGYSRVADIKVDPTSIVNGSYVWGYVELDKMKVNGNDTDFHPFTEAGARHIRYNQPELLYSFGANASQDELSSKSQVISVAGTIVSNVNNLMNVFSDYTNVLYGNGNDRLSDINLDKSYLRLRTPDKIKYGGGHRVKEIRVIDNWNVFTNQPLETSSTYGVVYDYNMEENGEIISSGVAAYEPLVGGDEIALRNPVSGWQDKNILSKNIAQTYTEEPGNESLFPGPNVGYRQVKVMSKNTSDKVNGINNVVHYSGISVHEFFTAKEFPVITKNTELQQNVSFRKSRLIIPAIIVNVDRMRMAASQGYYIELNNMHGQPKGQKELKYIGANQPDEVVSSVEYEYFADKKLTTNRAGETFYTYNLNNEVNVLFDDVDPNNSQQSDIRVSNLGTEVEFIPETRYVQSRITNVGLGINTEYQYPAYFGIYPIPYFSCKEEKTGTVVTNKIVNKTGIVKKVIASQKGSTIETENLAFDDITGNALLTSVTNDYNSKIYNYSILARDQYDGAGPSYLNIGKKVYVNATPNLSSGIQQIDLINYLTELEQLVKGDVILATPVNYNGSAYVVDANRSKQLCRYSNTTSIAGQLLIETTTALNGLYEFTIVKSGRKNNLNSTISTITALSDPTKNRLPLTCEYTPEGKTKSQFKLYQIDNVLNISAIELGQMWYKDTRQLSAVPSNWYDNAYYSRGFGGIYSPVRSYSYIDNRSQTTLNGQTNVNLSIDGVMNDVNLFNWQNILANSNSAGCASKWKEVDQITLKNPSSFDIETKNPLKVFSSSIYGRNGTEPIAVAGNAKNTEIGVENFEEYSQGSLDVTQNTTNNLNFYSTINNPSNLRYAEDRFDVINGAELKGTIEVPVNTFASYNDFTLRVHFDAYYDMTTSTFYKAEEVLFKIGNVFSAINGVTRLTLSSSSVSNVPFAGVRFWRGELFAKKTIPNYPASANLGVSIIDSKGHTGDKCIALSNPGGGKFLQGRLTLQEGKEYQFSGWFSSPNNAALLKNNNSLFENNFEVQFLDANGNLLSTQVFNEKDILQGGFIDDWQKFAINFTMPVGAKFVSFTLPRTFEVFSNEFNTHMQVSYFDDLRIQPRDAAMTTYVYNQENLRLEAQLDDNNFATFYYYDDEGHLFLVKRETEKGIITVQESRSYLKKSE